ncbi:SIR2 family protein [Paraburkholderia phymatum]|nr:SIR2 family protein [Paraburkholderia phymatum]
MGLESWAGLLATQCELHGLPYGFLSTSAKGDLPELASGMARELHPRWWKEEKYKESRAQFEKFAINEESALKFEIAKYIKDNANVIADPDLAAELDLFKQIVVDGIVTTNWDGLLEALFPDYDVYVGQEALLFAHIQGIGEIYKIHGSFEDPNSLVLTSADYGEFHRKNPYLASKLLTFFVENPIVFIGYSLTDPNILDIIHSVLDCLSPKNVEKLGDRLVFVHWDKDSKEDRFERTILSKNGRTLPVFQATTNSMSSVLGGLTRIKRKIPAKVLRMLKKQVYELVHATIPSERVYVQDIDANTDLDKVEFAIGVGIQERLREKGYTALSRVDIARDVIFSNGGYRADMIVRDTLPALLKGMEYVPVFKYLHEASAVPKWNPASVSQRVIKASKADLKKFQPKGIGKITAATLEAYDGDFATYTKQHDRETVINRAGMLPWEKLNATELQQFLADNIDLMSSDNITVTTNFFKLVCIYDWLAFGQL